MTVRTYQYVRHDRVDAFLADGWVIADDMADCHHGRHSVLMRKVEDDASLDGPLMARARVMA